MSTAIIYGLIDPRNNELRYIGKTARSLPRRLCEHICITNLRKKNHRNHWLLQLRRYEIKPEIIELETIEDAGNYQEAETFWISYMKYIGCRLTNITSGGEGTSDLPEELRMRCGDFRRGKKFTFSKEHIGMMKKSQQKRMENPILLEKARIQFAKHRNIHGHKWSKESRDKASISAKKRNISKEERMKISLLGVKARIEKYKRNLMCVICQNIFEAIDIKAMYCSGRCKQHAFRKRKIED